MRRLRWALLLLSAGTTTAAAQEEPTTAQDTTEATSPRPSDNRCMPECREGFFCHEGTCVEACNPPCGPGERCTSLGECLPTAEKPPPPPAAPPAPGQALAVPAQDSPPAPVPGPPPPVPQDSLPRTPPDGSWQPRDFRPYRDPTSNRYLAYGGLHFGAGGHGSLTLNEPSETSTNFDFNPGGGFQGSFEFRISPWFGIGPGLRLFQAPVDGTRLNALGLVAINSRLGDIRVLEVLAIPTFHIPVGSHIDVLVPIPVGVGAANIYDSGIEDGYGASLGLTPGVAFWFNSTVGVYIQAGLVGHVFIHEVGAGEELRLSFTRGILDLGVTFGF